MLQDPLANALSHLLNYDRIGRREVTLHPAGKVTRAILSIMNEQGFVGATEELSPSRGGIIKLHLLGRINKCGAIKPRFSVQMSTYEKFEKRFLPAKGVGIILVSTPKGIMHHEQAKSQRLGGRLLAYCY